MYQHCFLNHLLSFGDTSVDVPALETGLLGGNVLPVKHRGRHGCDEADDRHACHGCGFFHDSSSFCNSTEAGTPQVTVGLWYKRQPRSTFSVFWDMQSQFLDTKFSFTGRGTFCLISIHQFFDHFVWPRSLFFVCDSQPTH